MNNVKVERIERIILALYSEMLPFDIISDVEKFLGVKNCVLQLCACMGDKYVLTICSTQAIKKLLHNRRILVGRKKCPYQFCEKKLTRLKILQVHPRLRLTGIDSTVRRYGKVLYSEIEKLPNSNSYFAVMDLKIPVPERIGLKRQLYEVVCF